MVNGEGMRVNPKSVIPSMEVLEQCRAGITRHIRKTKSVLAQTKDKDIRKLYYDKVYKLKVIREQISFLIREL